MGRAWITVRAAAVLTLSAAGTAAALSAARTGSPPAQHAEHAGLRFTSGRGALQLDSSHPGTAIFGGTNLAPGESVNGDVSLTAVAAFPADVTLTLSDLVENLGPGGAHLTSVLRLQVVEEPAGGVARVRYEGLLRDLGTRPLDTYAAGETRTYHFTATLPDVPGVNAVQGASATAAFAWNAQEATAPGSPDGGTPTPDAPAPDGGGVAPAQQTPGAPGRTVPAKPTTPAQPSRSAVLRVRLILPITQRAHMRNDSVIGWAVCSRPCRLVFSGRAIATRPEGAQRAARAMTLRPVPAARGVANRRTRLVLRLTPAARRALKGKAALRVTLTVTATDAAGRRAKAIGNTRVTR
jgi:hypothetical protein